MKISKAIEPLIEDGVIDTVVRSLKSGKDASVYVRSKTFKAPARSSLVPRREAGEPR